MTSRRESPGQGARRRGFLAVVLFLILGISFVLTFFQTQMLSAGGTGVLLKASPGDLFTLRYTHSMYGVEVNESFLIGSGDFTLFHVSTSEAALEYFGLEHAGKDNVRRTLKAFRIPRDSVGNHKLLFKDRVLELAPLAGEADSVSVKLIRVSVFKYLINTLRR